MSKDNHKWNRTEHEGTVDDKTVQAVDETVSAMLDMVQKYESKEDYWFVKYYEVPCLTVFTMGAVANIDGNNLHITPGSTVDDGQKKKVFTFLDTLIHNEMTGIFKGREELVFRIFAYGTHYSHGTIENKGTDGKE